MAYLGKVRQWDVLRADLEFVTGSEQGGSNRPVIVVSNDGFNERFDVVTVVPLTKLEGKKRKLYPFEYLLPPGTVGHGMTSIVQAYQIHTISKIRLLEKIGNILDVDMRAEIEARILQHLGIEFDAVHDS